MKVNLSSPLIGLGRRMEIACVNGGNDNGNVRRTSSGAKLKKAHLQQSNGWVIKIISERVKGKRCKICLMANLTGRKFTTHLHKYKIILIGNL